MAHRTTEDLRETLFGVIDDLRAGRIDKKDAQVICNLAKSIIETADLEITVAKTYLEIDKKGTDTAIGAYLLTKKDD
jgi:hypothetical protein